MNAYLVSRINALVLIVFGLWGYFQSESPSPTAFIPVVLGVLLLFVNGGVKKQIGTSIIIALVISFATLGGLIMPLKGALGRDDSMAVLRVMVMIVSTITAIWYLISARLKK